ncbi:hypothetical protein PZ895_16355 [Mesorhizobium sp. YIM 152430]|jgi:hypothetical protein|uniref:hypothetical protein n=1 Tax=Mesorhizobium sp. YIM 152430 TaxID=3031761 RepID=UPI0023DB3D42|nr:hypothetical protein [Mesorhizobium sp. YIM 152430]MDF1601334.1 hypothetical protein [Mesorhizobium sp. YIM 152430]
MKNNRFPTLALAAWMALGAVASASALPIFSAAPATPQRIQLAQGDCYAVGQQIAAENGGTLAKATPEDRGGQQVCVIVVLVPGQDGQRPRRAEFVVPM